MSASTIQASFGLDIDPLKAGFNRAAALSATAAKNIGRNVLAGLTAPLGAAAGLLAGALALNGIKTGVSGVISLGGELQKLHTQTGISVGSLTTLRGAFVSAGVSSDMMGGAVAKMQRNLFAASKGSALFGDTFRMLGLNAASLAKLKPEEQFAALGTAIAKLPSPLARTSAAMALFGKSGAELLPVFAEMKDVDFAGLSAKGAVLEKDAETFHRITVAFHRARGQLQGIFLGIADGVAPALLAVGTVLSKQNALGFGLELGKGLRTATEVLVGTFKNPALTFGATKEFLIGSGLAFENVLTNGSAAALQFFQNGLVALNPAAVAIAQNFGRVMQAGIKEGVAFLLDGMLSSQAALSAGLQYAGSNFKGLLQSGVDLFSQSWARALLNPLGFLGEQLVGVAMDFGKSLSLAVKGDFAGAMKQSMALLNPAASIAKYLADIHKGSQTPGASFGSLYTKERASLSGSPLGLASTGLHASAKADIMGASMQISIALQKSGKLLEGAFAQLKKAQLTKDVHGANAHFQAALSQISAVQQLGRAALAPYTPSPLMTNQATRFVPM